MSKDQIFQILIADRDADGNKPEPTSYLCANIDSFRKTYAGAQYRLYEDADIRKFIGDRLGAQVLGAYDQLVPFAYKADLARYCILFELGGVYSDLSNRHYHPAWVEDYDLSVFRDLPEHPPWAISNGLIASLPKRVEFKQAIDWIVQYAETKFYGQSSLDVTGPYLFGRILAQSCDWKSIHFGRSFWARRHMPFSKPSVRARKVLKDGTLVALKVKNRSAAIDEFITGQGNRYNELWRTKRIWGEGDPNN